MPRYVNFFTAKGGQGCTVVAGAYALQQKERTLLIDWCGDAHAALGLSYTDATYTINDGQLDIVSADAIVADLDEFAQYDTIVMDRGVGAPTLAWQGENILVTRHCYLAMRRYVSMCDDKVCDGIVTIGEPGRALTNTDIERVVNAKVVASIPFDPAISRCVDAGLLSARMPQNLRPLANIHKENV